MKTLYAQWSVVLLVTAGVVALAGIHYRDTIAGVTPEDIRRAAPAGETRVFGMVRAGTLTGRVDDGVAAFTLVGREASLPVRYQGPPPENLRELKRLVVIGTWNATTRVFAARDIGVIPNYGFVAAAYVVGLAPLALWLFVMSRRVCLLYEEMKTSTLYREE